MSVAHLPSESFEVAMAMRRMRDAVAAWDDSSGKWERPHTLHVVSLAVLSAPYPIAMLLPVLCYPACKNA